MKSRHVLMIGFVALFTLFGVGQRAAQAAQFSLRHSDTHSTASVIPDGETVTVLNATIPIGRNQVDPPDPNAGRNWAMHMFVAFVGLSTGSIILNYLWIRTSGIKRR